MAASVLMGAAENAGLHFTVGAGGSTRTALIGNANGLDPVGPASWNRSLERALDEASVTGCVNLSGRKLKEFPRSAANHDLTDTIKADLSRNRMSELPLEVCLFVSLEYLNLYQNCLRSLPDSLVNLQTLTYLNLSRNQLSVLPPVICSLPLKVLIASNNKLVSLPEELGQLRLLTELDVSCNEIQRVPSQVGHLEALRDLNIRRNHLIQLPPELAGLPLVRLDFSCNKVTSIPLCYRRLTQLQSIMLDNNPLQSPPAQICIKGKVHIFKYLNMEASKTTPELPEYDRPPLTGVDEQFPGRPYGALDSGFNSVDSGDKRWLGNEPSEEPSEMPSRAVEITLHLSLLSPPDVELEQIDFIDSCAEEEEEGKNHKGGDGNSLSSQFMAYIERRITKEVGNIYPSRRSTHTDDSALIMVRTVSLHQNSFKIKLAISAAEELCDWLNGGCSLPVQNIEARLKVSLPSDLGAALTDGVVLCHLANHVRPRSVPSIHVPSPAVPKLTMAKCRRNVENFLEACRRIGVPQSKLCLPLHILEERGLPQVAGTVSALLDLAPPRHSVGMTTAAAGPSVTI
uniref:Leucine rich repeats and calponin homology domain containing 3 n=1 Tax=Nothobranchius furzeri TaxID=105023 RepID=A0A8C6KJ38_NOTFU